MLNLHFKILKLAFILLLVCNNVYAGDTSNLEAAWLLDEASGTRFDETANNNDLTDNNTVGQASGANCQFDECADFEDTNSEFLSITDGSQTGLDLTGKFTLLTWIRLEKTVVSQDHIMGKSDSGPTASYVLYLEDNPSANSVKLTLEGTIFVGTTAIIVATNTHLAVVYDQTDVIQYFDGSVDKTTAHTTDGTDTGNPFHLGARSDPAQFFDGTLDEAVVFSRDLSTSEINDIMDNGIAAFISPAAAFIPRVILMTSIMQFFNSHIHYNMTVNKHRKKFDIERPYWMTLLDTPEAWAATVEEKTEALVEFISRASDQASYKTTNGRYKQKWPELKNGMTYETHEYNGPNGVGYIQRAIKVEGDKTYVVEKHVGPETDRNIATEWTEIKND